jgi:hypothetical protein
MTCLKPGGIAVHTTEFNLSSNEDTFDTPGLSLYRQRDIEELAHRLEKSGHKIQLNLTQGDHPIDAIISDESSPWELNLKVALCGYQVCSVGLIVKKGLAAL